MAFGGPHGYTGRDMRHSHSKLIGMGMNDKHFDIVVEHLRNTLLELGVAENLIIRVVDICESTRDDVMNRSARTAPTPTPKVAVPPVFSVSEASPAPLALPPIAPRVESSLPVVRAIMSTRPTTLSPNNTIREASELFGRGGVNALPVVDESGRLLGMLTANDLVRYLSEQGR